MNKPCTPEECQQLKDDNEKFQNYIIELHNDIFLLKSKYNERTYDLKSPSWLGLAVSAVLTFIFNYMVCFSCFNDFESWKAILVFIVTWTVALFVYNIIYSVYWIWRENEEDV